MHRWGIAVDNKRISDHHWPRRSALIHVIARVGNREWVVTVVSELFSERIARQCNASELWVPSLPQLCHLWHNCTSLSTTQPLWAPLTPLAVPTLLTRLSTSNPTNRRPLRHWRLFSIWKHSSLLIARLPLTLIHTIHTGLLFWITLLSKIVLGSCIPIMWIVKCQMRLKEPLGDFGC